MTKEERIDELKRQGEYDLIWNIERTEGFEEHQDELLCYRLEREAEWEAEYDNRLQQRANEMRCSIELVRHIEVLERYLAAKMNSATEQR